MKGNFCFSLFLFPENDGCEFRGDPTPLHQQWFVESHWQVSWCGETLAILCVLTWTQPCSLLRWRRTGLLCAFIQVTNCPTLRRQLGSLLRSRPVTPSGLWQILSSCENWWVGRPGFIFCFFSWHPHLLNFLFLPFFSKRKRKQKDRLPLA